MSGYAVMVSPCAGCGKPIHYNPHKVPSIKVNDTKEPICRSCVDIWNAIHRTAKGLEPIPIQPGAYEGFPEEEL